MIRRLALVLLCQLVICHSLPSVPNPPSTEAISIIEIPKIHLSDSKIWKIIGGEDASIERYPYIKKSETISRSDWHGIVLRGWAYTRDREYRDSSEVRRYLVGLRRGSLEEERIVFGERVQPIELPTAGRGIHSGTVLDIAGWGTTTLLGMPSDTLNHNIIHTISKDDCRSIYSINSVTDRMFCVFDEGNGPCVGDTGSPAVVDGVLIGVASWSQSCAYNYPTAYARLPEMVDWITEVTGIS